MTHTSACSCASPAAALWGPAGQHRHAKSIRASNSAGQAQKHFALLSLCRKCQAFQTRSSSAYGKAQRYTHAAAGSSDASARQQAEQAWSSLPPQWRGWRRTMSPCCASSVHIVRAWRTSPGLSARASHPFALWHAPAAAHQACTSPLQASSK